MDPRGITLTVETSEAADATLEADGYVLEVDLGGATEQTGEVSQYGVTSSEVEAV